MSTRKTRTYTYHAWVMWCLDDEGFLADETTHAPKLYLRKKDCPQKICDAPVKVTLTATVPDHG